MLVLERMTRAPVTITAEATVDEALSILAERKQRHLPILDADENLIGIVSEIDARGIRVRIIDDCFITNLKVQVRRARLIQDREFNSRHQVIRVIEKRIPRCADSNARFWNP